MIWCPKEFSSESVSERPASFALSPNPHLMLATLNAEATALPEYAESPEDLTGDFFVAHTKSRQEKAFVLELQRRGIGFYLPLVERISGTPRRRYLVNEPIFPGYVFVVGDENTPASVMSTQRVCKTIPVRNQPALRNDLMNLYRAIRINLRMRSCEITKGQQVRVTTGAFMGVTGVVVRLKNSAMLVLEVRGFGQAVTDLEIDGLKVEPV